MMSDWEYILPYLLLPNLLYGYIYYSTEQDGNWYLVITISYYNSANLCLSFRLSFDLHENRSHGELQTRPMCCLEPDDVQYDLSL